MSSKGVQEDRVMLACQTTRELRDRFQRIAQAEHRSVSAELRRLVELRCAEYEDGER